MADGDDGGGWQGFERVIDCDSRNVTESSTQTPRGWIIDMVTSGIGGALAGYLLVQFLTLFVYMNAPVLRPKQPHILLIQTWAAMMLSGSLLVYHGHFTRERGFFSICTLWDIWAIFISLGFFLNCQALRVVKVHRKRVEELDTNQMILNVNLRKQSDGTGVPGWYTRRLIPSPMLPHGEMLPLHPARRATTQERPRQAQGGAQPSQARLLQGLIPVDAPLAGHRSYRHRGRRDLL